ncbi:hypothetical protein [Aliikangiella maris]|uniref:Nucleoside 2-deoxyribosyltransferase n=2 Tax=Aliikangiella maris TaxID=3162458 RepID=A0ABV2BZ11_9GAMM
MTALNLFIRQPYTKVEEAELAIVQSVLDTVMAQNQNPYRINVLTGHQAYDQDSYKVAYEQQSGKPFNPTEFRLTRQAQIDNCDAMIIVNTGISEGTSFEVGYNIFSGKMAPMLFLVKQNNPIQTAFLQELDEISDATYVSFDHVDKVEAPIRLFLSHIAGLKSDSAISAVG